MDLRSNSHVSKPKAQEETVVEVKVVEVKEDKKSSPTVAERHAATFGDKIVNNLIVPALQDLAIEILQTGMDIAMDTAKAYIFKDPDKKRGNITMSRRGRNQTIVTDYGAVTRKSDSGKRTISRLAGRSTFKNVALDSRYEIEKVYDTLCEILNKYHFVSVSDYYDCVGLDTDYVKTSWGWDSFEGVKIRRVREGWVLDLPDPEPFD